MKEVIFKIKSLKPKLCIEIISRTCHKTESLNQMTEAVICNAILMRPAQSVFMWHHHAPQW